jgi:CRISPR-associated protein (TIGR02710 family)
MKKALIMTVGIGEGTENGIFESLKTNNPDLVIFLVSKESIQSLNRRPINASEKRVQDLCDNKIVELSTVEDVDIVFEKCEEIYRCLLDQSFLPTEIFVDITFGTKVMTAALTALAIIYRLDMTYVTGIRGNSTVKTGTERPLIVKPRRIIRRFQLNSLKEYFRKYQFSACLELAKQELNYAQNFSGKGTKDEVQRASDLVRFIEGFICWERFEHKDALRKFDSLKSAGPQREYLKDLRSNYNQTASLYNRAKGNIPCKYTIIDLLLNARRRACESNFDDAVARLYRCIEMTIQLSLAEKHNVYSDNVDLGILKNKLSQSSYDRLKEKEKPCGKIQLGLMEQVELLKELSPELTLCSPTFVQELKECLQFRNYSILAHGVKPVSKEDFEKFDELAQKFVKEAVTPELLDRVSNQIKSCFDVKSLEGFIQ